MKNKFWFGALRVLVIGAFLYVGLGVVLGTCAFWDTYGDDEPAPPTIKTTFPKTPNEKPTSTQTVSRNIVLSDVSPALREEIPRMFDRCVEEHGIRDPTFVKPSQLLFIGKAKNHSLTHISGKGPIAACMIATGVTQITLQSGPLSEAEGDEQWLLELP